MPPDETFCQQLRGALAHLYDYPYLQAHPLANELGPEDRVSVRERMRFLRTTILQAIEEMNPGSDVPLRSLQTRSYNVLNLHYVEGLMIKEVARELAISERQVYRDLRKAERDLAAILWVRHRHTPGVVAGPSRAELVLQEAERLSGKVEEVCVKALLEGAVGAVGRLAQQRAVRLETTIAPGLDALHTDRQIARQALVSALSYAAQNARPDTLVTVLAEPHYTGAWTRIEFTPRGRAKGHDLFPSVVRHLISRLGGQCSCRVSNGGRVSFAFTLGHGTRATVLVIDDNAGLIELFGRYLTGEDYRLIPASDGAEGLRLAEEAAPDIVVLDVMMPKQDGWEILQRLQNQRDTRHIPVIVCSVLDDPELAYSLGATHFLAKPVNRIRLLESLSRCWEDSRARPHPTSPAGT